MSNNNTVHFWNDPVESESYIGEKKSHFPPCYNDKLTINIFCGEGCEVYAKKSCDGIKVNIKCEDECNNCCTCCDTE